MFDVKFFFLRLQFSLAKLAKYLSWMSSSAQHSFHVFPSSCLCGAVSFLVRRSVLEPSVLEPLMVGTAQVEDPSAHYAILTEDLFPVLHDECFFRLFPAVINRNRKDTRVGRQAPVLLVRCSEWQEHR